MKKPTQLRLPPISYTHSALVLMVAALAAQAAAESLEKGNRPPYDSLCIVGVGHGIDTDTNYVDSCWKFSSRPSRDADSESGAPDSIAQDADAVAEETIECPAPVPPRRHRHHGAEVFWGNFAGSFAGAVFEGIVEGIFESGSHHHERHHSQGHQSRDLFDSHSDHPSRDRGTQRN